MLKKKPLIVAASLLSAALFAGCHSNATKDESGAQSTAPVSTTTTAPVEAPAAAPTADLSKHSVYFDFDKSDLKADAQGVVSNWASYLSSHPTSKVRLEGNCDERGTREYNVGLGERRGNAVAQALEAAGVSASQVSVVSYGKERPVCTQHEESCWSQNRRVDLVQQ